MNMKILAIGAHFDDIEIGCGGSLIKHRNNGDEVDILVVTDSAFNDLHGNQIRSAKEARKEGQNVADKIGAKLICGKLSTNNVTFNESLVVELRKNIEYENYDLIYTHWTGDVHLDHQNIARATLTAARHIPRILMYRSNWYETSHNFLGKFYVDISDVIEEKFDLLKFYKSEYQRMGDRWQSFFMNEHKNAGQRIGVKYAEVFEVVKFLYQL